MRSLTVFLVLATIMLGSAAPCAAQSATWHQGISKSDVVLRGAPVVLGQMTVNIPASGNVVVHFDGLCVSTVGDRIVLAASNTASWGVNEGNVSVKAAGANADENSFSHSQLYSVTAGTYTFYAVGENYVDLGGTGIASIYGSLTVKYFDEVFGSAFARVQPVIQTGINLRGAPVVVGQQTIDLSFDGYVLVRFDGVCVSSLGDRMVMAASNTPTWSPNDGNVNFAAASANQDRNSFSHSRLYAVTSGVYTYYAVAENYVDVGGTGIGTIYGNLTVEYFPNAVSGAQVNQSIIFANNVDVRTAVTTLGQVDITVPDSGRVMVHFDGTCISTGGDMIVLAASNTTNWGVNDGNVSLEAYGATGNLPFSHTRVYDVAAGSHTFYAVAQNYVDLGGTGRIFAFGSLSVEYIPGLAPLDVANRDRVPAAYQLEQNYPNPFNPSTRIEFSLVRASQVSLDVFNIAGQKVTTLVKGRQAAGPHAITWDGTDHAGKQVASGIYLYRLKAQDFMQTRKMILVK